jgi:fatty acid desaturase
VHQDLRRILRTYRRIDDRRAWASIVFDYAVICATVALASWVHRTPVTLLALAIIAGRQGALQGLVHSACHGSLFAKRARNESLEFLFAYPILDSVRLYREQHLEHHRDFALRKPDRFDYLHETLELSRPGPWARTWVVFIRPLMGHAGCVFLADVARTFAANRAQAFKLAAYWTALLTAAWWLGGLWLVFVYWVVPLVWLYPVLDIWSELSDHLSAKGESRNQEGLFYSALLKGHEMYHAVHHLYPFVPYYRLRDLHRQLRLRGVIMEDSQGPLDFLRIVYQPAGHPAPPRTFNAEWSGGA